MMRRAPFGEGALSAFAWFDRARASAFACITNARAMADRMADFVWGENLPGISLCVLCDLCVRKYLDGC